ncbi:hypothetical protein Bbelb_254780 [Branchiostoma belcheri]|nr:hypothetical protein Bbelb_254780 [Branchiostoma belcheri]
MAAIRKPLPAKFEKQMLHSMVSAGKKKGSASHTVVVRVSILHSTRPSLLTRTGISFCRPLYTGSALRTHGHVDFVLMGHLLVEEAPPSPPHLAYLIMQDRSRTSLELSPRRATTGNAVCKLEIETYAGAGDDCGRGFVYLQFCVAK